MSRLRHIRRPQPSPRLGWWLIRCDCGWEGRTPADARTGPEIEAALEQSYRDHLPEPEARTYLLVDTREPQEFVSLEVFLEDAADPTNQLTENQARARFAAQPQIIGTFVMPIGDAVLLVAAAERDGVHYGTCEIGSERFELPIGEVRTADGQVFRLSE